MKQLVKILTQLKLAKPLLKLITYIPKLLSLISYMEQYLLGLTKPLKEIKGYLTLLELRSNELKILLEQNVRKIPVDAVTIDSVQIRKLLQEFPSYRMGNMTHIQLDGKYWTCSKESLVKVIKEEWEYQKGYLLDRFDCDDSAVVFKALLAFKYGLNNVGVVIDYSSSHAYNLIVFSDKVEIFEPQSDSWPQIGSESYKFESGYILL